MEKKSKMEIVRKIWVRRRFSCICSVWKLNQAKTEWKVLSSLETIRQAATVFSKFMYQYIR